MFKRALVWLAALFMFSTVAVAQITTPGQMALSAANTYSTLANNAVALISLGIPSSAMVAFCELVRLTGVDFASDFFRFNDRLKIEQGLDPRNESEIWYYEQALQIMKDVMSLMEANLPEECR